MPNKDVLRRWADRIIPIPTRNFIRLTLKRHPFEYRSKWPDIEMFRLGRRDVVFDVGANVGDFTECVLAYQPWAVVHAFEPLPAAFANLHRKFADYPDIYCNETALGSTQSVRSLNVSSYDQASSFLPNGRVLNSGVYGIDFTVANTIDVPVDHWRRVRALIFFPPMASNIEAKACFIAPVVRVTCSLTARALPLEISQFLRKGIAPIERSKFCPPPPPRKPRIFICRKLSRAMLLRTLTKERMLVARILID